MQSSSYPLRDTVFILSFARCSLHLSFFLRCGLHLGCDF
ncbi:hypothetical protein SLEP1_g6840 [Rubroshorea leprosula]|uniref:Uncharacterized protein n=1 Tax=Rubroshorea leprosula TaxID=152421 RepID=A0AAV5HWI2_9ROSI|nr:hypothetical protein SLEP1_g6840 [Rubroshorea leprosula]